MNIAGHYWTKQSLLDQTSKQNFTKNKTTKKKKERKRGEEVNKKQVSN